MQCSAVCSLHPVWSWFTLIEALGCSCSFYQTCHRCSDTLTFWQLQQRNLAHGWMSCPSPHSAYTLTATLFKLQLAFAWAQPAVHTPATTLGCKMMASHGLRCRWNKGRHHCYTAIMALSTRQCLPPIYHQDLTIFFIRIVNGPKASHWCGMLLVQTQ